MVHAGKQKALIEKIENLGGVVWYDYQFDPPTNTKSIDLRPVGDVHGSGQREITRHD